MDTRTPKINNVWMDHLFNRVKPNRRLPHKGIKIGTDTVVRTHGPATRSRLEIQVGLALDRHGTGRGLL